MKATLNQMIQDATNHIAKLEAFKATNPTGYVVITGGQARLAIKFDGDAAYVTGVFDANRYDLRIAQAKARSVTNGNKEHGIAIYVTEQIDYEIAGQKKMVEQLTTALKNLK